VILLDAYALVALATDEPAAAAVEELLRGGAIAITAVNLAEAIDVAQRVQGVQPDDVRDAIEPLVGGVLRVVPVGEDEAWRAASLRLRHYDRRTSALSMADCFLLAAAGVGDGIATSDPPLAVAARLESIEVVALPDSSGRLP
jgi:predicted nucleic acid-binding protein